MFGTDKRPRHRDPFRAAVIVLAVIVLLVVAGHFVTDAACLALPADASPCTGVPTGRATGQGAVCGWHTGTVIVLLPALLMLVLLASRPRAVRPQAFFAVFAPPFQPPIAL